MKLKSCYFVFAVALFAHNFVLAAARKARTPDESEMIGMAQCDRNERDGRWRLKACPLFPMYRKCEKLPGGQIRVVTVPLVTLRHRYDEFPEIYEAYLNKIPGYSFFSREAGNYLYVMRDDLTLSLQERVVPDDHYSENFYSADIVMPDGLFIEDCCPSIMPINHNHD